MLKELLIPVLLTGRRVRRRDLRRLPSNLISLALNHFLIETKHFIYFYVGTLALLIWKS